MKNFLAAFFFTLASLSLVAGPGQQMLLAVKPAGGTPFSPSDIPGLMLWLKADGSVYNTGTTQATDGQTVETWVDASGSANSATQAVLGLKPTFQTNEINTSLPVIRFDGIDDVMLTPSIASTSTLTIFVVTKANSGANRYIVSFGPTVFSALLGNFGSAIVEIFDSPRLSVGALSTSAFNLFEVVKNGGGTSTTTYRNGVQIATDGSVSATTTGTWFIGSGPVADQYDGDIAEIIAYDTPLATGNRQLVEDYAGSKYGISITH